MLKIIINNILFYLGIIPVTIFFSTTGILTIILPAKFRYWYITRWCHFFIYWAKITCGLRYKTQGLENIPNKPSIVISNHQSIWETIYMQVIFPKQSWIVKKELFYIPFFGWGLWLLQPIAINRHSLCSIKMLLDKGTQRLTNGNWIIIFPEGTRVPFNKRKRFSKSGVTLAKKTNFPIIPLAHDAGKLWPKGFFIKKSGTINVSIGKIIEPAAHSAEELNTLTEQWINNKLQEFATNS